MSLSGSGYRNICTSLQTCWTRISGLAPHTNTLTKISTGDCNVYLDKNDPLVGQKEPESKKFGFILKHWEIYLGAASSHSRILSKRWHVYLYPLENVENGLESGTGHRDMLTDYWNGLCESCFSINRRDGEKGIKLTDMILFQQCSLRYITQYSVEHKRQITRLSFKDIGWYEMEVSPATS